MKQLTAMQQMIEKIESCQKLLPSAILAQLRLDAVELLPVEKQTHKDAYNQGYRDGESDSAAWDDPTRDFAEYEDAEQYFNQTFKTDNDETTD